MFKLRDKKETNVFDFSKLFKEFWSEHSQSVIIPSYVILSKKNFCAAILLFKNNDIIESTIRVLRNGAGIDSFALCIDGDITKNFAGNALTVSHINKDIIQTKIFNYEIDENYQIDWVGDLEYLDPHYFYKFQSILHQDSSLNDIQDIVSHLGYAEDRQYFHNLRFVFSFLEKNENIYVIDLISASHPEWIDAEEKFIKLLDNLKLRKFISAECANELVVLKKHLGKAGFGKEIEEVVKKHWENCNTQELTSPAVFSEILHRKVFDYKYDLHNYESICW